MIVEIIQVSPLNVFLLVLIGLFGTFAMPIVVQASVAIARIVRLLGEQVAERLRDG